MLTLDGDVICMLAVVGTNLGLPLAAGVKAKDDTWYYILATLLLLRFVILLLSYYSCFSSVISRRMVDSYGAFLRTDMFNRPILLIFCRHFKFRNIASNYHQINSGCVSAEENGQRVYQRDPRLRESLGRVEDLEQRIEIGGRDVRRGSKRGIQ